MSSTTEPVTGYPVSPDPAAAPAGAVGRSFPELAEAELATRVRVGRGGPPEQLLEQMAAAAALHQRLVRSGLRVAVTGGCGEGPLAIELQDRRGRLLRRLSSTEAIELACGEGRIGTGG